MNSLIQDLEHSAFNEVQNFIKTLPEQVWEDKELFDGTILDRTNYVIRQSLDKMNVQEVNKYIAEFEINNPTAYHIARTHVSNNYSMDEYFTQNILYHILLKALDASWEKFKEWKAKL